MPRKKEIHVPKTETIEQYVVERGKIRATVRGTYDLQKQRISTGNRVVANFRSKLGVNIEDEEESEEGLSGKAKKLLDDLKKEHHRITDALINSQHKGPFPGQELIDSYVEYCLVSLYVDQERMEVAQFKRLGKLLKDIPIYDHFLSKVKGVGPAMAGVMISEFDITKSFYVSSMWKYAGLDVVVEDRKARSKREEHLVPIKYTNSKGEEAERMSITFNPWLRTKLLGVLATGFLRSKSPYSEIYYNYRNRIESDPTRIKEKDDSVTETMLLTSNGVWTKARINRAALRYMVKMFLIDLYVEWRKLYNLPVTSTYAEGKLGIVHRPEARRWG